jgi:conjugative relaxase-like TrwC/TraI family protein
VIVSVTTLGSRDGNAAAAATAVVRYLEGRGPADQGRDPGPSPEMPGVGPDSDIIGYYADSTASPGIWMGRGMTGVHMDGLVEPAHLHRVLVGQNPHTGDQLAQPPAGAVEPGTPPAAVALRGPDDELLTLAQGAKALGVDASYLRERARTTHQARALQRRQEAAGQELTPLPSSYLDATRNGPGGHWKTTRAELRRFAAEREKPTLVVGYDLTFSAPKSVSILWATANPAQQVVIEAALTESVRTAMAYLEDHAAHVRMSVLNEDGTGHHLERHGANGLVAAAYLHETSRALDPQLHFHVVAANMAEGPDGKVRALDGRSLYMHAKTAGYLAAAELRHRLSMELGVAWKPVHRGVADIDGVSRDAIVEVSQRSRQIDEHIEGMFEHQPTTARGRQVAAYDTRAAKDTPVDPEALRPAWAQRLADVAFDRSAVDACYGRQRGPQRITDDDRRQLFALMSSAEGVTEFAATFDRRDVLQFVAEWGGDRLNAGDVATLADTWLTLPEIVPLEPVQRDVRSGDVIRRSDGRTVSAVEGEALYTTQHMLAIEGQITGAYERARYARVTPVAAETVDRVLAERPYLGDDQVEMVRSITSSTQRIQLVYGPAGSGKTTALEAASRAWEDAGYEVIGAAVQGTASEIVGEKAAVDNATVASILWRLAGGDTTIGPKTVVLVDECSTLGNRDLAHLARESERRGFILRLVGDPAQHSAVAAGGAWRRLLAAYPDDRAQLTEVRRHKGEEMEDVRQALAEWRVGDINAAISRLDRSGRVHIADNRDDLLTAVTADWYADRQRRAADPELEPSSMVTERHRDRRELNTLARAKLVEDGTLSGPVLRAGELEFQRGDEVIALEQDRDLRPEGSTRRGDFVHTAERGVVVDVNLPRRGDPGAVVVDFTRRGHVVVPMEYLTRRLDRGIEGALAHSYALTSYAAEGETYDAARAVATDASSAKGVYVGVTRGEHDLRLYMVLERNFDPSPAQHPEMPRLDGDTSTLQAVTAQISTDREELLASEVDPLAGQVAALRQAHSLPQLDELAASGSLAAPLAGRAVRNEEEAIAARARLSPSRWLIGCFLPLFAGVPPRDTWDEAVGQVAVYRARYLPNPVPDGPFVSWALGAVPDNGARRDAYSAAGDALLMAEQSSLLQRTPAQLAQERAHLRSAMAPSSPQRLTQAIGHQSDAQRALTDAEARHADALDAQRSAERGFLRRPTAKRTEVAVVEVEASLAARAAAADALRRATERVAALQPEALARARLPLEQRLARIDRAIAAHVDDGVASPAPYLTTALGPRPSDPAQRDRWNTAARHIETWRQAELGLAPSAGELGDDGLAAAIGAPPEDPALALRHDLVVRNLPVEFQPTLTVGRAMEGPALSID